MKDPDRNPVEVLAEEFLARRRRGEKPTVTKYMEEHPELATEISELFPAMLLMERMKPDGTDRTHPGSSGTVTGGLDLAQLGDYRIVKEIGRGGMGIVYEAVQESLLRTVALKVLPAGALPSPRQKERFKREARAAAGLHHPNIVPVFGVGEQAGISYFVMERIHGRGLDELLRDEAERPDFKAAAGLVRQAAKAIAHAHLRGTLHRDVKPANLLLDESGTVRIMDFGLAKVLAEEEDLTRPGDILGTIRYMPPERFLGRSDERGDIYGLGITLYELITGQAAFTDRDQASMIHAIREEGPTAPRQLVPDLPRDLETILLKAIALEPEHRYATAGELVEDLTRYLADRPLLSRRAGRVERLWRWSRRNRSLAAASLVALLALLVAATAGWAAYLSTSRAKEREELRRVEAEAATKRAVANEALSLTALESIFLSLAGADRPPQRGGDERSPEREEQEAEVLQSILSFYDAFAARNETDPRLRLEAARAHRRVAMILERLNRNAEALVAFDRALANLEGLAEQNRSDPTFRVELARTLLDATARAGAPEGLDIAETRCRRALAFITELSGETAEEARSSELSVTGHFRLATVLARKGDLSGAGAELEEALRLREGLGRPQGSHLIDAAKARLEIASLVPDEKAEAALGLLDAALADLDSLQAQGRRDRVNPKLLVNLYEHRAACLRSLDRDEEAREAERRAREARPGRGRRDRNRKAGG